MASLLGQIPSTTTAAYLKALSDAVFQGNPVFKKLYQKGIKYDGGQEIREPIIAAQANGGPFSGMETLVAPDNNEVDSARYSWKQFYASVGLDGLSLAQNSGVEAMIDLWGGKLEVMQMTLEEKLATSMWTPSGTGASTDLTLIEEIAGAGSLEVGTLTSTEVGTWAGAVQTDHSGASLTYAKVLTGYLACSEGNIRPDLLVGSKGSYAVVEALMTTNQRYIGGDKTFGFENILFHDAMVVWDGHVSEATTGGSTIPKLLRLFYLNTKFLHLSIHKDNAFRVKEVEPNYQDGRLAFLFLYGNLTCNNRRFQGFISDFT